MAISDIIVIALIALFGVIGVLIAVKKSLLSLAAFIVAFAVAFFMSNVIAEAMLNVGAIRFFVIGNDGWSLYSWINGGLGESLDKHYPIDLATLEMMPDAIPTALGTNFYAPIFEIVGKFTYSAQFTIGQGVSLYLAFLMFSTIIGIGLFIVVRLILIVVTTIIKAFFGKTKTGAQRGFGLVAGMVQGLVVSIALLIALSAVGGLTFVGAFDSISSDIESSVIAKHVSNWAYAIRNGAHLPDENMYGRIVELSGFTIRQEDKDRTDETDLIGPDLEMYNYLRNLNYINGDPYKIEDGHGVEPSDKENGRINAAEFEASGFKAAIEAIMAYNDAAAEKIQEAGSLYQMEITGSTVSQYLDYIQTGASSIRNIWKANNSGESPIYTLIYNYQHYIESNRPVGESAVTAANAELKNQHRKILEEFEKLEAQYSLISEHFGKLDLSELLPETPYEYTVAAE